MKLTFLYICFNDQQPNINHKAYCFPAFLIQFIFRLYLFIIYIQFFTWGTKALIKVRPPNTGQSRQRADEGIETLSTKLSKVFLYAESSESPPNASPKTLATILHFFFIDTALLRNK